MDSHELDDAEIVRGTEIAYETPDPTSLARLRFVLPGGREVVSDLGKVNELRSKMVKWCGFVREQLGVDAETIRKVAPPLAPAALSAAVDPDSYIRLQLEAATAARLAAETKWHKAQIAMEEALFTESRWRKIVDACLVS